MVLTNETYTYLNSIYVYLFVFTKRTLDWLTGFLIPLSWLERSGPSDPSGHLVASTGTAVSSRDRVQGGPCQLQLLSVREKTHWLIGADWMVILGSFGFHPPVFFFISVFYYYAFYCKQHVTKFAVFVTSLLFSTVQFIVILSIFP